MRDVYKRMDYKEFNIQANKDVSPTAILLNIPLLQEVCMFIIA